MHALLRSWRLRALTGCSIIDGLDQSRCVRRSAHEQSVPLQQSVPARLARVREVMASEGVDALLVPSADPHLSEYLPGYWQGRQWLSGFHGSVGTLVVTRDFAGVWADSRYWEQAQKSWLVAV